MAKMYFELLYVHKAESTNKTFYVHNLIYLSIAVPSAVIIHPSIHPFIHQAKEKELVPAFVPKKRKKKRKVTVIHYPSLSSIRSDQINSLS
jgi:hypothetical protein